MTSNLKNIISAIIFLALGIGIGYLLFGKQQVANMHNHAPSDSTVTTTTNEKAEEWICSMHPQIRQAEPGLCPICEMDLIPAGSNESNDPLVLQMTEEAVKLSNIQTTIIGSSDRSGTQNNSLKLSGKIQADEREASSLVAHVPGRIEKLFVSFTGEFVKEGQELATIYSPELITAQRELIEALKLYDINPKLLEAARNKLRYWKIGNRTIEKIEQQQTIQETFTIYAEKSGIVSKRRVAVGDYLKQGEPLFDLINMNKLWVIFDAYEEDLPHITIGDKITFTTAAVPNKTFQARVNFIDPILNSTTRTTAIRTEISNKNGLLKPEMFVEGTLQKSAKNISSGTKTVPKSAVLWTGKRSVVYVKVPETEIPSFEYREVEIGESIGSNYKIISGLDLGEEVVTYGSFTIDAAAQLNNQSSMMNKNVELKKEASGAIPNFQANTPTAFKEQLNALANAYIEVKDAFVQTDASAAASAAQNYINALEKVDMSLLKEDAHIYWTEQGNILKNHGQKIIDLKDVEAQRVQFGFVSDALINSILAFGTEGNALYVQHCPMAFDNEGGDWLALEEQIQNPYFGDKMMKCGLVKKIIE